MPILDKKIGGKERKLIYAGSAGGETRNVPTSKAERARAVLDDGEILELARQACTIERHYGQPMDIEWARDGETGLCTSCRRGPKRCARAPVVAVSCPIASKATARNCCAARALARRW